MVRFYIMLYYIYLFIIHFFTIIILIIISVMQGIGNTVHILFQELNHCYSYK